MIHGADVRALAARGLSRIVSGQSLREAFADAAPHLPDVRDRALLSALLHDGARWWLRLEPALGELLDRPLRARDEAVRALLVLGLVQLEILRLPAYAAVDASVQAARALGRDRFAGLINAVLRRWLRERERIVAKLDADVVTATAHPRWLIDALHGDWPQHTDAVLAADNAPAAVWLRVNRRRATREQLAEHLRVQDLPCTLPSQCPDALVLGESADVRALPGYAEGWFSVQDGAAQQAADLLEAADGMRVLDACAAPGGKSAHLLERADVDLLALDAEPRRLARLRENLSRLGLRAQIRAGDAAEPSSWWDGTGFDRILLDAPCSATGIIRRQPDIKLHRRAADVATLAAQQKRLLAALWPLLRGGGRLVYATCSMLRAENADVVADLLGRCAQAQAVPVLPDWHRAGDGAQNLPGEAGMDGFFYAVLEKSH